MEKQSDPQNRLKLKKRDAVFLGIALLIAAAGILWFSFGYRNPGTMAVVTVDGQLAGSYSLAEDREVPIPGNGTDTNLLAIAHGQASMQWADCPDQICVEHAPISHAGEEIVCLPNRVVVRVVDGSDKEGPKLDAIAR